MQILLLENDPSFAEIVRLVLEHGHHTVSWTPSGVEALAIAARRRFDLALLDVDVDELSGLGVERVLRDMTSVPVVVMSGRPNGWRREALSVGAVACVEKPLELDQLLDLTRTIEASSKRGPPLAGDVRQLAPSDLDAIARMSRAELDALPFGTIRIDREGRITAYNAFEADAAGLADEDVRGKRFADIAPCVLVKEFIEAATRARAGEPVDEVLRFVFPHHGAACVVSVRLYLAEGDDQLWLLVSKRLSP